MLDYPLLAALAAVVREGSFERAARALHLSPAAVSQRVKLLEQRLGQVLVVRSQPCVATAAGQRLVAHTAQVTLLEAELAQQWPWPQGAGALGADARPTLPVAVNADSLATWFIQALARFAEQDTALLDVRLEDEAHTAEQLRRGEVLAAVTTMAEPVQGCRSEPLGAQVYLATASPAFIARHFARGVDAATLARAPCLTFNPKDRLQDRWMQDLTGQPVVPQRHWLPATQAFVDATLAGLGWGLNPLPLVQPWRERGALRELVPDRPLAVPLYWQSLRHAPAAMQRLADHVHRAAAASLAPWPGG